MYQWEFIFDILNALTKPGGKLPFTYMLGLWNR